MTHYFTTDASPGSTYTNVACGTTALYGQLYPFPPELMPTTSAASPHSHAGENGTAASPTEDASSIDGSSTSGISAGAVAGAVVGAAFAVLAVAILVLLVARRHQRRQKAKSELPAQCNMDANEDDAVREEGHGDDGVTAGMIESERRSRLLLRLSTIQEQPPSDGNNNSTSNPARSGSASSPLTTTPPPPLPRWRRSISSGGVVGALFFPGQKQQQQQQVPGGGAASTSPAPTGSSSTRRAHRPEWPLGSGGPLESHPVDMHEVRSATAGFRGAAGAGSMTSSVSSEALPSDIEKRLSLVTSLPPPPPPPPGVALTTMGAVSTTTTPPPPSPRTLLLPRLRVPDGGPGKSAAVSLPPPADHPSSASASRRTSSFDYGGGGGRTGSNSSGSGLTSSSAATPGSSVVAGTALRPGPRLSYHRAALLDTTIHDEVERRVNQLGAEAAEPRPPPPPPMVTVQPPSESVRSVATADEVSPIEDEDDYVMDDLEYVDPSAVDGHAKRGGNGRHPGLARLSMISVASVNHQHQQAGGRAEPGLSDHDVVVSPVFPDDEWQGEEKDGHHDGLSDGRVSPRTVASVSLAEIRRDSARNFPE
jgi:hypothetical protein